VKRLTTISGVAALSIVAAVGDFHRFSSPQRLVSYLGLNPRVRQSGGQPAQHGRIAKQGRAHARGMLVEAAWMAAKIQGPAARLLRAGAGAVRDADRRRRDRAQAGGALLVPGRQGRGLRLPAPVADREEAARSSLRTAALPSRRGQKGKAAAYSLEEVRRRESALAEQGEQGYRQLVADWQAKAPATRAGAGAATGERL